MNSGHHIQKINTLIKLKCWVLQIQIILKRHVLLFYYWNP